MSNFTEVKIDERFDKHQVAFNHYVDHGTKLATIVVRAIPTDGGKAYTLNVDGIADKDMDRILTAFAKLIIETNARTFKQAQDKLKASFRQLMDIPQDSWS